MSKQLIEQLAKEHGSRGNRNSTGDFLYEFTGTNLEAFAKAYQAAAPVDVPPDEYDIVVDTGDGIYHTAELVHFQQEGSKRSIQVKLKYAAPIDSVAEALERLVKLKLYKDKNGKDEYYEKEQPEAWLEAIRVLMRQSVATGEITGALIPDTQAAPIESERE
jgi:hypothetical protein